MRWWLSVIVALGLMLALEASPISPVAMTAVAQQNDDQGVPPGNPVIGDDRPGDIEASGTNYGLWALVAVCLIGAGVLLVKIERWEARRLDAVDRPGGNG